MAKTPRKRHDRRRQALNVRRSPTGPPRRTRARVTSLERYQVGGTKGDADVPLERRVRPRYYLFQRAVYNLIETGKPVTQAAIAAELGIRRQNAWKFFRRHPEFLTWLHETMTAENEHLIAPLARRH